MNNIRLLAICLLLCGVLHNIRPAVIFFDVGYTVMAPSSRNAFYHMGFWPTIRGLFDFSHGNPFRMAQFKHYFQNFYINTLHRIPSPCSSHKNYHLLMPDKTAMPDIMQDFMVGSIDSKQALACIRRWAAHHCYYFKNPNQQNLFLRTADFNFSENALVDSLYLLPCAELLKQCKKNGHICIIVSNWARSQVAPLCKKLHATLPYIDACIFSCDGYGPKPCETFYKHCMAIVRKRFPKHYKKPWVIVDDQVENLVGAKKYMGRKVICTLPHQAPQVLRHLHLIH